MRSLNRKKVLINYLLCKSTRSPQFGHQSSL